MSDTPLTDAMTAGCSFGPFVEGLASLARQLERELSRCNEKRKAHERTLAAMTEWLDKNQPDVFRRGIWDAIAPAHRR